MITNRERHYRLPYLGALLLISLTVSMCAKEEEAATGGAGMISSAQAQGLTPPENTTEAEYKTDPSPPPFLADGALTPIPSDPAPTDVPTRLGSAAGAEGSIAEATCLGESVTVALWKHATSESARAACRAAATELGAEEGDVDWASGMADDQPACVATFADGVGASWVVAASGTDFDAVTEAVARARAQLGLVYPETVGDWALEESARAYDRMTVYEPIDGGAEQYFRYNFARFYRGRYVRDGMGIVVDVYEESGSADAWGVQSAYVTQNEAEVGQMGYTVPMQLTFWQGPYFCRLKCERRIDDSDAALLHIGQALSDALVVEGIEPDMLSLLWDVELDLKSAHYCHEVTDLTPHFYISTDNVLELGKDTDCLVGKFAGLVGDITVLAVRYPDTQRALDGLEGLAATIRPDAAPDTTYAAEWDPGKCMSATAEGEWLIAVFDVPMPDEAENLKAAVLGRLP